MQKHFAKLVAGGVGVGAKEKLSRFPICRASNNVKSFTLPKGES